MKRLVCIEDLGNIEVLLTDKTGTLTEGRITFEHSISADGTAADDVVLFGLLCSEASVEDHRAVGGNPLDVALWDGAGQVSRRVDGYSRIGIAPFDHDRRRTSVLVDGPQGRLLITKGAPEGVLGQCSALSKGASSEADAELAEGGRVVAVATRPAEGMSAVGPSDEHDLALAGYLVFLDPPKRSAAARWLASTSSASPSRS